MKRVSNIYKDIYDLNHVRSIYHLIRTKCNNKKSIYNYDLYESIYLYRIIDRLYNRNYKFNNYYIFLIREPKYRLIMSESISDKIVNHLVSKYILIPSLEHKLIDTNVATRINKGSGYAFKMVNKFLNNLILNNKNIYCLKIDIKKYFYNINHKILFEKLKKDIKDREALKIIYDILDTTNKEYINKKIVSVKLKEIERINKLNISNKAKNIKIEEVNKIPLYIKDKGLGIGNMTSQILAIYYLNEVDHLIKEELKCKYYIRYMDDLIILDNDLDRLKQVFSIIKDKIESLDLKVNDKSRIVRLDRGFSFLGYTFIYKNHLIIKVNNKTFRRIKKHLKNLRRYGSFNSYTSSLVSYKGFFINTNYQSVS